MKTIKRLTDVSITPNRRLKLRWNTALRVKNTADKSVHRAMQSFFRASSTLFLALHAQEEAKYKLDNCPYPARRLHRRRRIHRFTGKNPQRKKGGTTR